MEVLRRVFLRPLLRLQKRPMDDRGSVQEDLRRVLEQGAQNLSHVLVML